MGEVDEKDGGAQDRKKAAPTDSSDGPMEVSGKLIDNYKLLSVLGEGGCGVVYLAEQQKPVKRRVALKIIKPGMDSKRVLARFEAEEQALALLDHPNIAQVHDAGATDSGKPYFVMEYVPGISITEHCDRHKLRIEDRLKLFAQVCDGVQHAHQKGIIHRDIKPSNILVLIQGDQMIPKVIDFGVVKAISQPLTEKTLITEQGQLIGTPEYMSPEQAEVTAQDIDIRSDIYSMGVLLYELLTGALPFDPDTMRRAPFSEIQRMIREDDPPRPSTRFSSLGPQAKSVAQKRRTEVGSLSRRLQKELEWIPLKAIRKDRRERYRSASEFADDIHNYLNGAPLIAGPESTAYRVKKFVRKRRAAVAAALAILTVVTVGFVVSTILYFREDLATKQARQARDEAERKNYVSQIRLAQAYIEDNNYDQANETLWQVKESLRQWEWGYLLNRCNAEVLSFEGETLAAYSPNGEYILTAAANKFLTLRDASDGHEIWRKKSPVIKPVFSPDGENILIGLSDGEAEIRSAETGDIIDALPGHQKNIVSAVAFSPNGSYIATGGYDKKVQLWDAQTYKFITSLDYNTAIEKIIFNHEGNKILVYLPQTSTIDIREISTEKVQDPATKVEEYITTFSEPLILSGRSPAFSPDGKLLLYADGFRVIITDMETRQQRAVLDEHEGIVKIARFSNTDGRKIITGTSDGKAKVWDTTKAIAGEPAELIPLDHGQALMEAAFSPDDTLILTASEDGLVKVWDALTYDEICKFESYKDVLHKAFFSPDCHHLITSAMSQPVKVWDACYSPGQCIVRNSSAFLEALDVVISKTSAVGTSIATLSRYRQLDLLNLEEGRVSASFACFNSALSFGGSVSFDPDGKLLAATLDQLTPVVIDLASLSVQSMFSGHQETVNSVNFSSDGSRILSTSSDDTARVWDAATGVELLKLKGHTHDVLWGDFSPDRTRIVTASQDNNAIVWDSRSGQIIHRLVRHTAKVCHAAFSHDDLKIVTSSADNTAIIWDTGNYESIILRGHTGSVLSACFSPDDKRIVTSSLDNTCKIWDTDSGDDLVTLRGHKNDVTFSLFDPAGAILWSVSYDRCLRKWEAAPWRLKDLPGNDSQTWQKRYELFRQQQRMSQLQKRTEKTDGIIDPPEKPLIILTTLDDFHKSMQSFRDAMSTDIPKTESFAGLQIHPGPMLNALVSLCFNEGDRILSINEIEITDYIRAAHAIEQLLQQAQNPKKPDITMEIQRQKQRLLVKFQFINRSM